MPFISGMGLSLLYLILHGLEEQVLQWDFQLRRPVQEGGVLVFSELDGVGEIY